MSQGSTHPGVLDDRREEPLELEEASSDEGPTVDETSADAAPDHAAEDAWLAEAATEPCEEDVEAMIWLDDTTVAPPSVPPFPPGEATRHPAPTTAHAVSATDASA